MFGIPLPILLLLLGMGVVLGGVLGLRLHPFLALVGAALCIATLTPRTALEDFAGEELRRGKMTAAAAEGFPGSNPGARVAAEFGEGCRKVGILIAMAAIIGKCLLDSGAAQRIVAAILAVFGVARAQLAFLISGFVLAIPVFFDTVFYLLIPIGKAMRRRVGKNYLLYILTIVAGATMAHSLVPPTPGPLLVAGELDVDLGTMMLGGLAVGACTIAFGYAYATWANARHEVPLRESEGEGEGEALRSSGGERGASDGGVVAAGGGGLPPLWLSLLPIVLPVVLIGLGTLERSMADAAPGWLSALAPLGDKNIALTLAALVALGMVVGAARGGGRRALSEATRPAIASAANIIVITAAGAAFGGVLHHTGIAQTIAALGGGQAQLWTLPIVFLVTALVRTAQGSATVAMITAAPIAKAFLDAGELGFHPVYLALAIGCGSKPVPWMNDSGWWVITRMTGMRESETLRFVTPMMSLMGVVGLLVTLVGAWLLPLA